MTCPKCGAARPAGAAECPKCGVIYARFEQKRERQRQEALAQREQQQEQEEQQEARREAIRASAMIDCPVCGKHVSRLAPTCPHCGNPIFGTVPLPPVLEEAEQNRAKRTRRIIYVCVGLFILYCFTLPWSGGGGGSYEKATGKPSPEAAPGTPSTPRTVTLSDSAFGCHDIGDFWLVVTEARKGDVQNFSRVMNRYADEGKCDMVRAGTATALEFLPAGAVRIRDANDTLWWVSDASVRL